MSLIKSWKKPTPEQIKKALALLVHPQQRQYFFNRLDNPEWVVELKNRNWFKSPPPAILGDSSTVSFPNWSESRYLARMAVHRPEEVLEIGLAIETDNPSVHQDFIEAALNMPPDVAAKMEVKIRAWIEKSPYSFHPLLGDKVGELISFLAKGGQSKVALKLAHALLAVLPAPQQNRDLSASYRPAPEARPRFDEWHYNFVLVKNIPDLVAVAGERTLKLLCGLLKDTIVTSGSSSERPNDFVWEDYSYIWRPLVEDNSRNSPSQDLKNYLVVAVRDAAQQILEEDSSKLSSIVMLLNKWHWRIFHRIAINLVRYPLTVELSMVSKTLTNSEYFGSSTFHQDYEYTLLAHEYFADLSQADQETILNWISYPALSQFEGESPEEYLLRTKHWQLRRLTPIKEHLVAPWKQIYEELTHELEAIELIDLLPHGNQVRSSMESPKTVAELAAMDIQSLVEFLKTWQVVYESSPRVEDIFDRPSKEGLAWTLQNVVESAPLRYAAVADQFKGISTRYLTCILRGLRKLLNQEHSIEDVISFPWASVLSLCSNIVEVSNPIQTLETESRLLYSERQEARRAIADSLGLGLSAQKQIGIPLELREQIWTVLYPLTIDLNPTPDYETHHYNSSKHDFRTLSINTVRGEALHTVIRYALWLRGHQESSENHTDPTLKSFDGMSEVKQVLENHLNLVIDPSLAIRSIYGQWFPWLTLLDESWTRQHIFNIFPHDEQSKELRQAAWNSYIFCSPYDKSLELLFEEYSFAIDQLSDTPDVTSYHRDIDEALVHHLMVFYWRGRLDLEQEDGLLVKFYLKASVPVRKQAIEFVGRSLWHTKGEVDQDIQVRLVALWNSRLAFVKNPPQFDTNQSELVAFGWWFASGKLDASWSLAQLSDVLTIVGEIEADHFVVEQLAKLAGTHLQLVLECLRLLVTKDTSDWRIQGWSEEACQILTLALQQNTLGMQQIARDIINLLGRRGYWEFRNLLQQTTF